jgi:hypothetical protein
MQTLPAHWDNLYETNIAVNFPPQCERRTHLENQKENTVKDLTPMIAIGGAVVALLAYSGWGDSVGAASLGPFQIAAQPTTGNTWVLDTSSGQVRLCRAPKERIGAPECTPWTE